MSLYKLSEHSFENNYWSGQGMSDVNILNNKFTYNKKPLLFNRLVINNAIIWINIIMFRIEHVRRCSVSKRSRCLATCKYIHVPWSCRVWEKNFIFYNVTFDQLDQPFGFFIPFWAKFLPPAITSLYALIIRKQMRHSL
jgi:hypothetical protein